VFRELDRGVPPLKSSNGGLSPTSEIKIKLTDSFSNRYLFLAMFLYTFFNLSVVSPRCDITMITYIIIISFC
jgi:hypothetical protein